MLVNFDTFQRKFCAVSTEFLVSHPKLWLNCVSTKYVKLLACFENHYSMNKKKNSKQSLNDYQNNVLMMIIKTINLKKIIVWLKRVVWKML